MQWLWVGRLLSLFLGRDVFIPYSHSGAEHYAKSLARQFREERVYPFFAGTESKPRRQTLEHWLARALRRSTILVLIGEPRAFKSQWVAWELKTFAEKRRDALLITISIGTALQDIDLSGTPFQTLRDRLCLSEETEALHRGQPPLRIVDAIRNRISDMARIKGQRRRFYFTITAVLSAVLLAFLAGLLVGKSLP